MIASHLEKIGKCALFVCAIVSVTACAAPPLLTPTPIPPTATITFSAHDGLLPPDSRLIKPGDLLLAADIDAIPAIFAEESMFVGVDAGNLEWVDDELVVSVDLNGEARAYPIRLLSGHEIVNDNLGGQPIAITWCPLCFSALVYDREVDGQALTFGVSGYLYRNNLVMYDHQTNTLWSQILGQAIRGAKRTSQLDYLPSQIISWGSWKAAHPNGTVLSAERLGQDAASLIDPYAGYYRSGAAAFGATNEIDNSLPAKTLIIGVTNGDHHRAYPLDVIAELGIIEDELNGSPLLLIFDQATKTVLSYQRPTVDGNTLTFAAAIADAGIQDEATGTIWDIYSGAAINGALMGKELPEIGAPLVFWFAWADLHPTSDIYAPQ